MLPLASPEADGGLYSAGLATASPYQDPVDYHSGQDYAGLDHLDQAAFLGLNFDTNRCKPNTSYVWCLPKDYNQEKHPFTCK